MSRATSCYVSHLSLKIFSNSWNFTHHLDLEHFCAGSYHIDQKVNSGFSIHLREKPKLIFWPTQIHIYRERDFKGLVHVIVEVGKFKICRAGWLTRNQGKS